MAQNKVNELLAKIKQEHSLDLSSGEDLSIAIMNLISLEEHFFFSGAKTGKKEYYHLLAKVRNLRKDLLKKIVKKGDGEVWCISKHLLGASMRLIEAATKYFDQDRKKEAEDLFAKAYDLYSLFWGINLKLIESGNIKEAVGETVKAGADDKEGELMKRLNNLVEELIDCCEE